MRNRYFFLIASVLSLASSLSRADCSIAKDEKVIFYPTTGYETMGRPGWTVPIHGCLLKTGPLSRGRRIFEKLLIKALKISKQDRVSSPFDRRAAAFLTSEEHKRPVVIQIGSRTAITLHSAEDGHFEGEVHLSDEEVAAASSTDTLKNRAVTYQIAGCSEDKDFFRGQSVLPASQGVSVISDIDDTIKLTVVKDRKEMLANTFLREYQAIPSMASLYSRWDAENPATAFYYMSSSPWQLFEDLSKFLNKEQFPPGILVLKRFRPSGRQVWSLFESPESYKLPLLKDIFDHYPARRFILVGDSGEKDPEIYGKIAHQYPDQVQRIYIRELNDTPTMARYQVAFQGIPPARWMVFHKPEEIPHD